MDYRIISAKALHFCAGLCTGILAAISIIHYCVTRSEQVDAIHKQFTTSEASSFDTETFKREIASYSKALGIEKKNISIVCYKGKYTVGYAIFLKATPTNIDQVSNRAQKNIEETKAWESRKNVELAFVIFQDANGMTHADHAYILPDGSKISTPTGLKPVDRLFCDLK
jgi:hypothetical protein